MLTKTRGTKDRNQKMFSYKKFFKNKPFNALSLTTLFRNNKRVQYIALEEAAVISAKTHDGLESESKATRTPRGSFKRMLLSLFNNKKVSIR